MTLTSRCDLPFGKQFGSEAENDTLYPAAVCRCPFFTLRLQHPSRMSLSSMQPERTCGPDRSRSSGGCSARAAAGPRRGARCC
jgi:hypothetical protein